MGSREDKAVKDIEEQFKDLGVGKQTVKDVTTASGINEGVTDIILKWQEELIRVARENIEAQDHVASGELIQGLIPQRVVISGSLVTWSFFLPFYWDFTNQGVNGLLVNRGSEFSFRKPSVAPQHQMAIQRWMFFKGIRPRTGQTIDQASYVIARSIKRKGIRGTNWWDEAVDFIAPQLEADLTQYFGDAVRLIVRESNKEISDEQAK